MKLESEFVNEESKDVGYNTRGITIWFYVFHMYICSYIYMIVIYLLICL